MFIEVQIRDLIRDYKSSLILYAILFTLRACKSHEDFEKSLSIDDMSILLNYQKSLIRELMNNEIDNEIIKVYMFIEKLFTNGGDVMLRSSSRNELLEDIEQTYYNDFKNMYIIYIRKLLNNTSSDLRLIIHNLLLKIKQGLCGGYSTSSGSILDVDSKRIITELIEVVNYEKYLAIMKFLHSCGVTCQLGYYVFCHFPSLLLDEDTLRLIKC